MTGLSAKIDTRKAPQEKCGAFLYDTLGIRWTTSDRRYGNKHKKRHSLGCTAFVLHLSVTESDAQSLCGLDELVVGRDKLCFACDF